MPIRKPIRDIGKQTILYGAGNALSKFAAFLLIPIYARFLSTSAVGILALLEMTEQLLAAIIPVGVMNAVWRYLPESKKADKKRIIISGYVGSMVLGALLLAIVAGNFRHLGNILAISEADTRMLLVVFVNVFLLMGIQFMLSLWQYDGKAVSYVVLSTLQFSGVLLVTIFLVIQKGLGLWGVLFAKVIVYALLFLYAAFIVLARYWSRPRFATYRVLLKYGFPLIILALVTPVLTVSDRFFLRVFVDLDDIGIYSINYRFGMLINMILVIPFQRGWSPIMYRLGIEKQSHEYYRDIMFYYAVVGAVIFLVISFFADAIIQIVATPQYLAGSFVIPIITLAYYINGFRQFFTAGAALKDKTPRLGAWAAVGILVNLGLNYLLIKQYGVAGAAWATLVSYTVLVVLIYAASQKLAGINWGWSRLVRLALMIVICYVAIYQFQSRYGQWQNLIAVGGLILFVVLLRVTNTIGHREIDGLKSLVRVAKKSE